MSWMRREIGCAVIIDWKFEMYTDEIHIYGKFNKVNKRSWSLVFIYVTA